jgi:hypothetical protein
MERYDIMKTSLTTRSFTNRLLALVCALALVIIPAHVTFAQTAPNITVSSLKLSWLEPSFWIRLLVTAGLQKSSVKYSLA